MTQKRIGKISERELDVIAKESYRQITGKQPPAPSALDELVAWLKEDSDSTYRITGQRLLSHECVLDKIAALRAREHKGGERDE